jgi:hypothetical protein
MALSQTLVMSVPGPHLTGREAAKLFAATHWENPREVAGWSGDTFRLVDGDKFYRVLPGRHGWDIVRIDGV